MYNKNVVLSGNCPKPFEITIRVCDYTITTKHWLDDYRGDVSWILLKNNSLKMIEG